MVARTFAVESLNHRTAGLIQARVDATPHDAADQSAALAAFEEYAVEASIAKVAGSEMLNFVLDENIQIHGGNGFVRDYPAERHYRDSRVNRIFEGTNEINRLLIPGMLARRAVKGEIGSSRRPRRCRTSCSGRRRCRPTTDGPLADEARAVEAFKKAALMVLGLAMQTYREKLPEQQEVLMSLADILIDAYAAESALLRATANGRLFARRAAGRRRPGIRQRRSGAYRGVGAAGAGGDARGRHAAHDGVGLAAAVPADAGEHGRAAAPARRRGSRLAADIRCRQSVARRQRARWRRLGRRASKPGALLRPRGTGKMGL